MKVDDIKHEIREALYKYADEIDWLHLTISQRKQYYEVWTSDPNIGGKLEKIMDSSRVRVYLKDTIMKSYSSKQKPDLKRILQLHSISCDHISQVFTKPQAFLCDNNQLYTLSTAKDWRTSMLSAFERAYEIKNINRNIIFITDHTQGRFIDKSYRDMISIAAKKLDIIIYWLN
ncbi:hypothetical protein F8S13_03355 [Chloroflexia bacterium SDU3-3]|nr:hypothetical protein F8S13_03355 [Chloroflexia bacterium SDU3-3]